MSHVDAVRRFNRFYTRRIGVLHSSYLGSPFPLPQARVLYEIGQRGECTASEFQSCETGPHHLHWRGSAVL